MGDLAEYSRDRVPAAAVSSDDFVGVDNLLPGKAGRVAARYRPNTEMLTGFRPGDVLLGNIRPYLKKIWLADVAGGCSGDVLALRRREESRDLVRSRYLYHALKSDRFFHFFTIHSKGAKMPRGDKRRTLEYEIALPPLDEQDRIVEILDEFDTLVNDVCVGLPAELAARRKQYEYYRDRLLTFPEAS